MYMHISNGISFWPGHGNESNAWNFHDLWWGKKTEKEHEGYWKMYQKHVC